jgi:oxygen-independent coproporphyrinogen-3 oxidase
VRKPIAVRDLPFEFAMNGFRLVDGFSDQQFEAGTGLSIAVLETGPGAGSGPRPGRPGSGHWCATPKGFRFLNDILVELLPDADPVRA